MRATSKQDASSFGDAATDIKAESSRTILHREVDGGMREIKLDFGSKGLTQVEFADNGDDEGTEARLHGTALYTPVSGWPTGYGQYAAEDLEGVTYPVRVNFRIALTDAPQAIEVLRRNTKIYLDTRDNGYEWHERFIAMWHVTGEGVWAVSLNHDPVPLPDYWITDVKPKIDASEAKWTAIHRRKNLRDSPPTDFPPTSRGERCSSFDEQLVSYRESRPEMAPRSATSIPTDGDSMDSVIFSPRPDSHSGTPRNPENGRYDLSELQEELLHAAGNLGDDDPMGADSDANGRFTEKQEEALAGKPTPLSKASHTESLVLRHRRRSTVEEQDALNRLEVERGWLPAVEILIQLADCLLAFHERRLALVVCRPEYFAIYPTTFKAKSSAVLAEYPVSLDLIRTSAIVPLSGYQDGKVVHGLRGDFDGDRVLASGSGAGTFLKHSILGNDEDDGADAVAPAGALEGTYDEEAIRRHLRYLAPEAISGGKKPIGNLVDVFSWGVAGYELLTGEQIEDTDDTGIPDMLRDIHLHSVRSVKPIISLMNSIPPELCDIIQKSVSLDPDLRYHDIHAVLYDLNKTKQICQGTLVGKARQDYQPGYIDVMSRFKIPPGLLDRDREEDSIDSAYDRVKSTGEIQTVCCWGTSGAGKSKLVELWSRRKEASNAGQECLVGWAKMDQHLSKPLSAFVAVFSSLLDRVFSDPLENPDMWRQRIGNAISVNGNVFLSLIPAAYRTILLKEDADSVDTIEPLAVDWDRYVKQFRSWSYGLLQLFATKERPLVIVLDDYQWIGAERELWEDLIHHPMRRLDNTLVLFTYRTIDHVPPNLSPFVSVRMIEARMFSKDTLQTLVLRCFHFEAAPGTISERVTPQWTTLVDFLYDATHGNPFYIKMILTALVRDAVVYYDFRLLKWIVKVEQLDRYATTGVVAFVTNTLRSLSEGSQEVLRVLATLPSSGVDIDLLADLVQKPPQTVCNLLDEAATIGAIHIKRNQRVQFTHDKHHQAALELITEQQKSTLYVTIFRKLEDKGDDYIFARAELATQIDAACHPIFEKTRILTLAAKRAIRVAAPGLAEKYLEHTRLYADFTSQNLWQNMPMLAWELTLLHAEVSMALRRGGRIIPQIAAARQWAVKASTRIDISTLLFRLNVASNAVEAAMQVVREAFYDAGLDVHEPTTTLPDSAAGVNEIIDHVSAYVDQPARPEDEIAISLAKLLARAGATLYSYSKNHSTEYFRHSAELIVSSEQARRHPAAAYAYTLQAILSADALNVELARAWLRLANTTKGGPSKNPDISSIEAVVVTLAFLDCASINDMRYDTAYRMCLDSDNMDTLTYACGLDLAGSFLAGRDVRFTLETGEKALKWLQHDFSPASKAMIASSIQLAANCCDSGRSIRDLQDLEGIYLTIEDNQHLDHLPPLFACVYWTNALASGLFFQAPEPDLRRMVGNVYKHLSGGSGTVMMFYSGFLLSWFTIVYDPTVDADVVFRTKEKLLAFNHNFDFRNMVKCLQALEGLKRFDEGTATWESAIDGLEDAIEGLDAANHHLLRGSMALTGAMYISRKAPNRQRLVNGYVLHAQHAYLQCNAIALARYTFELFPRAKDEMKPMFNSVIHDNRMPTTSTGDIGGSESAKPVPTSASAMEPKQDFSQLSDAEQASALDRKLSLESVLRSFLVLASEKSSEKLIQKVLRILMQTNRSGWGALALQDPITTTLHLRGAGSYDNPEIYNIPISDASDICPSTILLSASISQKVINTAQSLPSSIKNLIDREPFFRHKPPKHLLMTPLFVQGRFFGSLVLTGTTAGTSIMTSHVSLLATFAAIALEAHSAYEGLEQAVEARTAALVQALAHRQTFISSISHELRTPLYSISGLCAVMQNTPDLTPAQSENLDIIASSAQDLQRIVTAILDMAKLEAGGMTAEAIPFDLRDTLESSLESVAHISRAKGIELVLENDISTDPPGRIVGDPHRLRQCVLNLLSNAVKFSRAGDRAAYIKVAWTIETSEETSTITVSVTDNGIGIPKTKMNRLFHSFSQIDASITRQYGGSGLGLSITRGLARVLGGDCWAESAEGQGSTFYLMFKVQSEPSTGETFKSGPARRAILLTAPSESSGVLVRNLRQFNVAADIVEEIDDALLSNSAPHFLIVDVENVASMRNRLERIRNWAKDSKIIYLVSLTEVSAAMEQLGLTHESIVSKPINARALYDVTQNLEETKRKEPKRLGNTGSVMDKSYGKQYPMKILYVDDSSVNIMVGQRLLGRFGYKDIDVCYDGAQAVAAAEKTDYDLVFMDLQMPVLGGEDALVQIRASEKTDTPHVVALTANADDATRDRCMASGFDGFLCKPLVIQTLAETLKGTYEARYGKREEGAKQEGEKGDAREDGN